MTTVTSLVLCFALVFPVLGGGEYSRSYGIRHHRGGIHRGIDIYAEKGAPVLASRDGWAYADSNKAGGTVVYLEAETGERYYYAHLDAALVPEDGEVVKAGETIGLVGNSGNAKRTAPHLHFSIYKENGKSRNPYDDLVNGFVLSEPRFEHSPRPS